MFASVHTVYSGRNVAKNRYSTLLDYSATDINSIRDRQGGSIAGGVGQSYLKCFRLRKTYQEYQKFYGNINASVFPDKSYNHVDND